MCIYTARNMSISHCTRGRRQHGAPHISLNLHLDALIFFKYVPAPMTAFRYCVCCDGREQRADLLLLLLRAWVCILHTRAQRLMRVDFYWGWVRRKWKEMESSERSSYLAKWNMKFMIAFWSDDTTTSETRNSSSFSCFLCFTTKNSFFNLLQLL